MTTKDQSPQDAPESNRTMAVNALGKLGYLALSLAAVALAATGVGTWAQGKAPMTHWVLMAHASAAPLFAIGLTLVSLTWPELCRFGSTGSRQGGLTKTLFWLILGAGLVVILSGVVPMTPLFGTDGQHALYLTHRYSAIVLTGAWLLHLLSRPWR